MRVSRLWTAVAAVLCGVMLVGCSSSDDDDSASPEDTAADTDTEDPSTEPDDEPDDQGPDNDGPVDLCAYLPEEYVDTLNPQGKELVSTILLGDFTYLGCTVGDAYSIAFGIRVIDDGTPLPDLLIGDVEPLDGFGDEAYVNYIRDGGEILDSQTVARFGDIIVTVRNHSLGNSVPDNIVADEPIYEAMRAFAAALPDDIVERALTAEVDEAVCPAVDAEIVERLVGTVVLARGGHADDVDRCAYRGENGTQIRLLSELSDRAADAKPYGEPISLPNIADAQAGIDHGGNSVELTVISSSERLTFVAVIAPDRDTTVDADDVIAVAEELLTLVG